MCCFIPSTRLQTSAYELNPAELRELLLDLVAASLDKGVVSQRIVQQVMAGFGKNENILGVRGVHFQWVVSGRHFLSCRESCVLLLEDTYDSLFDLIKTVCFGGVNP